MNKVQCKKCLSRFPQKNIYTIQQFQYRKKPPYDWTVKYFKKLEIDEWDSFCEKCMMEYSRTSNEFWNETKL